MNNNGWGPQLFLTFGLLFLFLVSTAWAQDTTSTPTANNPKPAAGDLILPMPENATMVFRRVPVPGKGFWGDEDRIIQIGDAAGGIFEGLQRTQISGSFPVQGSSDTWEIILAKYELTQGQYIAVMGMDALLAVSGDPEIQKLPTLQGRALRDALMKPLAYISHNDVLEFIRSYNKWLFDPAHPERMAQLPTMDQVPGFIRLPTEDEWEYCARGGLIALEQGTFNNRLPFAAAKTDEFAWHLGNAKHQLRPIGLRQPDANGIHDLLGNVQEMTTGLFRPEIWQGKPGGVAVRGGSVSTPATDLRSSLRAELDVYAWNTDEKKVEERRSFNTGARLAIGANVVLSTAQRAEIEQEYEAYKASLRKTMPVGRTLDNLVSQASVQIGATDPIIERLIQENPNLTGPLATVQTTLDKAREHLELAQRESARSLAQDAGRNGVNLSVYLSRLQRLNSTLATAQELAEVSSRYQEQVQSVEKSVRELEKAVQDQLQGYGEKVAALGDYETVYIDHAFKALEAKEMTDRERLVIELLQVHTASFAAERRADSEIWLEEFRQRFAEFSDS